MLELKTSELQSLLIASITVLTSADENASAEQWRNADSLIDAAVKIARHLGMDPITLAQLATMAADGRPPRQLLRALEERIEPVPRGLIDALLDAERKTGNGGPWL